MIRKYLRSDASPVSGTTRACLPPTPVSCRYRSMRSRTSRPSLVRDSGIDDHPLTMTAGRNHRAVSDDAVLQHGIGADLDIVPQNRFDDLRRRMNLRTQTNGRAGAPLTRCEVRRSATVVVRCPNVEEVRVADHTANRAGRRGHEDVVDAA